MVILYFSDYIKINTWISLNLIVNIICLFLLTFLYESNFIMRIFAVLLRIILGILGEHILEAFVILFIPDLMSHTNDENLYHVMMFCSSLLLLFLSKLFIFIWKKVFTKNSTFNSSLSFIMPLLSFVLLIISYAYSYYPSPKLLPALFFIIIIINVIIFYLINYIEKYKLLYNEHQQLENQLLFQREKYAQISSAYRESRRIVHDTKKHYQSINSHIEKEEYDKLRDYLDEALNDLEKTYSKVNTGNLVIDAFVSRNMAIAEELGIDFTTDIQIVKDKTNIDDYDLCIIIGNLLENAVNACKEQLSDSEEDKRPAINVTVNTDENNNFVFNISNTKHSKNSKKKEASDNMKLYRGYGIENVRKTVEKLHGTYIIEDKEMYTASVVIPYVE